MASGGTRRNDPSRRQRIIDATLEAITEYGVTGTTHRRIAAVAGVPLGSVTYYFATLDQLLTTAFEQLARQSSGTFAERMARAIDRGSAKDAVIDVIAGSVWATPRTLLLSYELYAFAARRPEIAAIMREWMRNSRIALERWFDPLTARALDALVEGIGIHNSIDTEPLDSDAIRAFVDRIADDGLTIETQIESESEA